VKHRRAKVLISKGFRFPHPLARPTGPRCNRKIASAKTDVFRSLFHTKTQKNTRFPSILANLFQPKIEISQFERPVRLRVDINKMPEIPISRPSAGRPVGRPAAGREADQGIILRDRRRIGAPPPASKNARLK